MRAATMLVAAMIFCGGARARDGGITAEALKATFLYRFAGFVEWPPPLADTPLTIAVADDDDVAQQLERLLPSISVGGHPVKLRKLRGGDSLDSVHILYVGAASSVRGRVLRHAAIGRPILLVGDSPGALAQGATINFLDSSPTVKFEISLSNAERSGLKINSRLLGVAARVEGKAQASAVPISNRTTQP